MFIKGTYPHFIAYESAVVSIGLFADWQELPGPVWLFVAIVSVVVAIFTWPGNKTLAQGYPSDMSGEECLELERIRTDRMERLGWIRILALMIGIFPLLIILKHLENSS